MSCFLGKVLLRSTTCFQRCISQRRVQGALPRRNSGTGGRVKVKVEKRSWPSIIVDILEVTLTASNKTRIMYRSNLNFNRFNRYFEAMVRKGFIEEQNGSNGRLLYQTTERGRTLLEVLRVAQDLVLARES